MSANIEALSQGAANTPNNSMNPEGQTLGVVRPPENTVPPVVSPVPGPQGQPVTEKNPEAPKLDEKPTHEQLSKDAQTVLETVKLDSSAVEQEWFANGGKLNEATYEAFAKAGISKDIVDNYGKMLQSSQQQSIESQRSAYQTAVDESSGGRDKTVELIGFLNSGAVSANEYQTLYNQLNSGNSVQGVAAINRLKTLHAERYGNKGNMLQGVQMPVGDVFNSIEEAQLAFNETMKGDPREREMKQKIVMDKLQKTNKARVARGERPFFG